MSILSSTNTGYQETIKDWCHKYFDNQSMVKYRIIKDDHSIKISLAPETENGLIILDGKEIPCRLYFEGNPVVFFTFFTDESITHLSKYFDKFCSDIRFMNAKFTEKSAKFFKRFYKQMYDCKMIISDREIYKDIMHCSPNVVEYLEKNKNDVILLTKPQQDIVMSVEEKETVNPGELVKSMYLLTLGIRNKENALSISSKTANGLYNQLILNTFNANSPVKFAFKANHLL